MERKSKQQKYVQMIIANNQNTVSIKLNKDNALEISFLPLNKDSDFHQDQIWIPPPAKTSRRLPGSQKYAKNNIIINIPADRTIASTNGQTLRIEPSKKQEKMIQEKLMNPPFRQDDKISELHEQTHRMKGTFDAQEHILSEAEELLKKHENKQKILSKYCRTLKKNMQDITKSMKELENQDNILRKTKSREKAKAHYNEEDKKQQGILSSLTEKTVYEEIEMADISEDENLNGDPSPKKEYSPGRKLNDSDEGSKKKKLQRICSMENVSTMYLPTEKSAGVESEESNKRQSNRTETKGNTRQQLTTQTCIPTENLMMKLSDNMRKTKLLIDAVYQENEDVDLVQRKYVSEVEKLYREQQELLEKLYNTLSKANSDATTGSLQSFQVDDAQNPYDNTAEKSSTSGQTKEMKSEERLPGSFPDIQLRKETRALEDRLEYADKKLTKLKDELEATKTPQSKYEIGFNEKKSSNIYRDLQNRVRNQPGRPSLWKEPVISLKKDSSKDTPHETRINDSLNHDDYSCQTEITEVVRRLPSHTENFNTNNSKVDDVSKNDSFITETKIIQKSRFLPLNSKENTVKASIVPPITDILKDINRSIDNVKPFFGHKLPKFEYESIEEGSLTLDDNGGVLSKDHYERDTSRTQDESTKISERSDYNGKQKHQTQTEYNKHKENGRAKSDFGHEDYSITDDNTRHKNVPQKSYSKNSASKVQEKSYKLPKFEYESIEEGSLMLEDNGGVLSKDHYERDTSRRQDESTKISERSDYNKKQKHQTQMECNKHKENGRAKSDFGHEVYSTTNDNTRHKDDPQKSYSKNRSSKVQEETKEVSEYTHNDKTRQKYEMPNEYNQHKGNERETIDFKRQPIQCYQYKDITDYNSSQSFTQLSTIQECDCSGECTNSRHFIDSSYRSPSETEDKSKEEIKFSFLFNERPPLAESSRIDDDTFNSRNDNQNKKTDPSGVKTETKPENKFSLHSNQTPLAESTRIDKDYSHSKNNNQRKNSDSSRVKANSKQENEFSFHPTQTPLAESTRINDDNHHSKNDYQIKKSDTSGIKNKRKQENSFNFHPNQAPLAESTRINGGTFNSETDYKNKKNYPTRVENKSRQENKLTFSHDQTPVAKTTEVDYKNNSDKGFKSQNNRSSQTDFPVFTSNDSAYQYNFQSDLYSKKNNVAPDAEDKKIDTRTFDKNNYVKAKGTSNNTSDQPLNNRHMQTTLNEFLYSVPIMSKEKFPDAIFANSPRKVIQCEYKHANSIPSTPENDDNIISNMEKASDKINALYSDIMSHF